MSSPLASAAGPIALVAGLTFAAVDVSRLLAADTSKERIAMMRETPFQVTNALYFVVFIGLLLALVSVYLRYHADAGALGAVAFCFALVGTMDMAGNMWFDGFAAPWIADVAPEAILAGGSGMLAVGGLSSYVLFALGWMVFGIAGWRARMFPAWLGAAFVVAGVLGYNAGLPPYGIPIGLAMAALGWWITRSARGRVTVVEGSAAGEVAALAGVGSGSGVAQLREQLGFALFLRKRGPDGVGSQPHPVELGQSQHGLELHEVVVHVPAEVRGIVRIDADVQSRGEHGRQRMVGQRVHRTEPDIGQRAHRQRHPLLHKVLHQFRVLHAADAVVDPLHVQQFQRIDNVRRRSLLAGVRNPVQARLLGPGKQPFELGRRVAHLGRVQADAGDRRVHGQQLLQDFER